MRADALRRRETLVREARRIFAEEGAGVALEAVAEAAGVGIATLYRNFPSRAALLDAVSSAILEDVTESTERARALLEDGTEEAWTVWSDWAGRLAGMNLGALAGALAGEYGDRLSPGVVHAQEVLSESLDSLLELVRARGLVGDDVTPVELVVGIGRLTRPQRSTSGAMDPDLGRRLVQVLLAGLRSQVS